MEGMCIIAVAFSLLSTLVSVSSGQSTTLYSEITKGYEKQVMPIWNKQGTEALKLQINMYPGYLAKFDELNEEITLLLSVNINWTDPRLSWDFNVHNQFYLIVTTEDIWLPYLYLVNSADELKPIGHESNFYAYVILNGQVLWTPAATFKAVCTPNVLRFPFDTQSCEFMFQMLGLPAAEVEFILPSEKPDMTYFIQNSDWKVEDITQRIIQIIPQVTLNLTIRRQSMYYIVTVLLPTLMFALMNPLVFCLPAESGERISLGMTILLAYAIFLTIVASSIPGKSDPICVIILALVLIMVVSGLVIIFTIISAHYYFKEETDDVRSCLKWLAIKCKKRKDSYMTKAEVSGKNVAHALDIIFCILSYFLFIAILVTYFIYIAVV